MTETEERGGAERRRGRSSSRRWLGEKKRGKVFSLPPFSLSLCLFRFFFSSDLLSRAYSICVFLVSA
jgi:hypothetical protein